MNLRTLTVSQACERTGLPRELIYRLIDTGAISANRLSNARGSQWHIAEASLEAWVTRRARPVVARAVSQDPFPEITEKQFA